MIPDWLALGTAAVGMVMASVGCVLAYARAAAGDRLVCTVRIAYTVPAAPETDGATPAEPPAVHLPPPLAGGL